MNGTLQQIILHLLLILAIITLIIAIFAIIVSSTDIHKNRKQFWRTQFIALGVSYILGPILALVFHVDPILIAMITLLVAFVIQGDIGLRKNTPAPEEEQNQAEFDLILVEQKNQDGELAAQTDTE